LRMSAQEANFAFRPEWSSWRYTKIYMKNIPKHCLLLNQCHTVVASYDIRIMMNQQNFF
jgi:hypothetical protein